MKTIKRIASAAIALSALGFTTQASASGNGKLIINEYNGVGPSKMLQDCAENGEGDIFFDCDNGNGANWIELVVTADNLDISGWKVSWRNSDSGVHANNGSFKFSNANVWTNLRKGTIITVRDDGASSSNDHIPSTYDPCNNEDWWVGVDARDTAYITDLVWFDDSTQLFPGELKTDNDCWQGMIEEASSTLVQSWVGETSGCTSAIWAGGGVSSEEVGKLEANPVGGASDSQYKDGDSSTFGGPNVWSAGTGLQSLDAMCNMACGSRTTGCCDTSAGDYSCYAANIYPFYY